LIDGVVKSTRAALRYIFRRDDTGEAGFISQDSRAVHPGLFTHARCLMRFRVSRQDRKKV